LERLVAALGQSRGRSDLGGDILTACRVWFKECKLKQSQWNIEWNDGLAFGIPELDDEHRELAVLSNDLNCAIDREVCSGELNDRMKVILDRAKAHFDHEEALLTEVEYPLRKGHHLLHEQLWSELQHVTDRATGDMSNALWREYGLLVRQLIEEHFMAETARYKAFLV
jgi:hemerythrin-like metal-binding protein